MSKGLAPYLANLDAELNPALMGYLAPVDPELDPASATIEDYMAVDAETKAPEFPGELVASEGGDDKYTALKKYMAFADEAAADERAGLGQLEQYISDYASRPKEIDWTPLAGFLASRVPNSKALEVAKLMRPETEQERADKLTNLQNMLQQRRGALTQRELGAAEAALKQQLAADQYAQKQQLLQEKMAFDQAMKAQELEQEKLRSQAYDRAIDSKEKIALMQLEAAKLAKADAQDRADKRQEMGIGQKEEKQISDQVIKLGKDLSGELPALAGSVQKIEELLGGSLDSYDTKSKTLNGKVVDVPGKSIPGLGRVYMPGSVGEEFDSAFKGIFNSLLKQRSGAAVTNQELARLRSEFAAGRFNTEEKMIEALHRFKKALRQEMLQKERSYRPETIQRFKDQGGMLTEDLLGMQAPPPAEKIVEHGGKKFKQVGDTWEEVTD